MRHIARCLPLLICGALSAQAADNADRVGVLVTGWGSTTGISREYSDYIVIRSIIGEQTNRPGEPCTEDHVGTFPFQSEKGLVPFAASFKTPGFEQVWDSYGIWRRSADGRTYTALYDTTVTLAAAGVGDARVTPLKDFAEAGVSANRQASLGPDPRDGKDHLAGLFKIDQPNGLHDAREMATARWTRVVGLLGRTPDDKVELAPEGAAVEAFLKDYLGKLFGDRIDVRFSSYAPVKGITQSVEDGAVSFAKDGFKNLLLARETTDHNNYANTFLDLHHARKGLCRAGIARDALKIEQVRQVGRTPEYNTLLVNNMRRHMDRIPKGSDVSVMYVTFGLPWPGGNPNAGPFSAPQPFVKEVYHENAYLNYLSFRPYAMAAYDDNQGGAYNIRFDRAGRGGVNSRTTNLYAYSLTEPARLRFGDDPEGFRIARELLETSMRIDGRKEIVLVLSHWFDNTQLTQLDLRFLNDFPLNSIEEIRSGTDWITWCERYIDRGRYEQRKEENNECPPGFTRIHLTEAFGDLIDQFALGYAQRIRGGIERFGLLPDLDISVTARGQVTKLNGGRVEVTEGPLRGVRLEVRADPKPNAPEGYTWDKVWRPTRDETRYEEPDAIRPVNNYGSPRDFLDAAKDDFTAYIGTQRRLVGGAPLTAHPHAVSPVVLVGPYRTLFNAPARVTLPYDPAKVPEPQWLQAYVFNDLTGDWDPVHPVSGGGGLVLDGTAHTLTFDVQALGNFVLATN